MASDIDNIDKSADGALLAPCWYGYACDGCGCYHIDLMDNQGEVFARMAIEPPDMEQLGHILLQLAADHAMEKLYSGGKLPNTVLQ